MTTQKLCKGVALVAGAVTAALWLMSFAGYIR